MSHPGVHSRLDEERMQRLVRLFLIYHIVAMGGRLNSRDLALSCGCKPKTIQRDLHYLREAEAHITWDARRKSYVLQSPLPLLKVELSLPEILALALWREAVPQDSGLPHEAQARSAFAKLVGKLPAALRDELGAMQGVVNVEAGARHHYHSAPLQELVQAAKNNETVQMCYYTISRNEISMREVDPYSLTLQQGYFNLVAYCHQRKAVLLFALDNIRSLQGTGKHFQKLPGFTLSRFLEGSLGMMRGEPTEIVVRFEPSIARWANRTRWGFPHTLCHETDGSLLLRGTVSGLDGIRTELLRWGAPVTVLEPAALREALLKEAQAIVEKYQTANETTAEQSSAPASHKPSRRPGPRSATNRAVQRRGPRHGAPLITPPQKS